MFFLSYLRAELGRRRGRTILTVLGMSVGVALVVATSALGAGLDRAQQQVLGPLSGVATDITVTKSSTPFAAGGFAALETDLSKLGEAGEKFSTETFFSTQGNITKDNLDAVKSTDGVATTSSALLLQGLHQEGTVPKITAEITTGGEEITQTQDIEPMNEEEQAAFEKCMQENTPDEGDDTAEPGPGGPPGGGARFAAANECLPERFREQIQTFRVPRRVITQDLDAPETDINSNSYTIAGIEPDGAINLISPEQVADGRFLSKQGEALVSESYASAQDLKVGSTLKLKDLSSEVVGLVTPPLGGQSADIYLTLSDLQTLSDREGQTNVLLARAEDAAMVDGVSTAIEDNVAGADVSDASDLAEQVAGSLVDSGNLIKRLGLVLAIVGIVAAVLIAALLTLSSVAKRTRELGTLKAIGWRPALVVRQIIAESAVQGLLGGLLGIGLGVGAAALLGTFSPSLSARAVDSGPGFGLGRFGGGGGGGEQASQAVQLTAPVSLWIIVAAAGLAICGGLIAGAIGSMRAARLRPADAMREVG